MKYHPLFSLPFPRQQGFTLLELLIVITIIAVLSVILILIIDPAETLKKSRDSQRLSDLNTLKTAISVYSAGTSTVNLSSATSSSNCKTGSGAGTYTSSTSKVWYSVGSDVTPIAATVPIDLGTSGVASATQATAASSTLTNGQGWVPINFDGLIGGSPISNEPLDPTNSVTAAQPVNTDLTYRYICNASTTKWEANARLESNAFTVADNKMKKDGGSNDNLYEMGTNLQLLGPTGNNY